MEAVEPASGRPLVDRVLLAMRRRAHANCLFAQNKTELALQVPLAPAPAPAPAPAERARR